MEKKERRRRRKLRKRHMRWGRVTPEDVRAFRQLNESEKLFVLTEVLAGGGSAGNISGVALLTGLSALVISAGRDSIEPLVPVLVLAVTFLGLLALAVNSRMHNADNRARVYEKYLTDTAHIRLNDLDQAVKASRRRIRRPVQAVPRVLRRGRGHGQSRRRG